MRAQHTRRRTNKRKTLVLLFGLSYILSTGEIFGYFVCILRVNVLTTFINTVGHSSVGKCAITDFYGLITSFITTITSTTLPLVRIILHDFFSLVRMDRNTIMLCEIV